MNRRILGGDFPELRCPDQCAWCSAEGETEQKPNKMVRSCLGHDKKGAEEAGRKVSGGNDPSILPSPACWNSILTSN
jgi:hypothetical protein